MKTKTIKVICWFKQSEFVLSKFVIKNGLTHDVTIQKVIDPLYEFTRGNGFYKDTYNISGDIEHITTFVSKIMDEDLDVEIEEVEDQ